MPRPLDFSLIFGTPAADGTYPVTVQCPAGSADGRFDPTPALRRFMEESRGIGAQPSATRDLGGPRRAALTEGIGAELFDALFAGRVKDRFSESLGMCRAQKTLLRIRLQMNLDTANVAPLARLPWELLQQRESRMDLALWPDTTVLRFLSVPIGNALPPFTERLRVLFVMANPRGDLDLTREQREIEQRLARDEVAIERTYLERATVRQLERVLHDENFDIVHFMGHGGIDGPDGVLFFESEQPGGGEVRVKGSDLARLLVSERRTRLVILNACRTAEAVRGADDPYKAIAPALVIAGVPAVIAMQVPITDSGAVEFSARLYSSLSRRESIESAVREGRRALLGEWATPVIFARYDDELFPWPPAVVETPPSESALLGMDVRELLPYMVDRTKVLQQLDTAIRKQRPNPSSLMVAFVHGDDVQCHDALQQRLWKRELPRMLKLPSRTSMQSYEARWPDAYQKRRDLHDHFTWALQQGTACQATDLSPTEELQHYFGSLPAPVMIHSHVHAEDCLRYGDSPIDDFLAYWREWPRDAAPQRLFIFLFIKYRLPDDGGSWLNWSKRREAGKIKKVNEAIAAALDRIARTTGDGVDTIVLPRLEGVLKKDVEDWNRDHGYPLPNERIRELFDEHERTTGEKTMSMETVGQLLKDLCAERLELAGGVA
jgi:hypothetical protein